MAKQEGRDRELSDDPGELLEVGFEDDCLILSTKWGPQDS